MNSAPDVRGQHRRPDPDLALGHLRGHGARRAHRPGPVVASAVPEARRGEAAHRRRRPIGEKAIVVSVRYAIDGEPIRLRFITATAVMLLFWTVCDVVIMLGGVHAAQATGEQTRRAWVEGISAILNQWGLGLPAMTLAAFAVAIGAYRAPAPANCARSGRDRETRKLP